MFAIHRLRAAQGPVLRRSTAGSPWMQPGCWQSEAGSLRGKTEWGRVKSGARAMPTWLQPRWVLQTCPRSSPLPSLYLPSLPWGEHLSLYAWNPCLLFCFVFPLPTFIQTLCQRQRHRPYNLSFKRCFLSHTPVCVSSTEAVPHSGQCVGFGASQT